MKFHGRHIAAGTGLGAILLVSLAGGSNMALAGEDLYRWQDSESKTVLSDRPPPEGVEHEVIKSPALLDPEDVTAADTTQESDKDATESPDEKPTPSSAERCEQARANMEALTVEKGTVTVRTTDGGARELSPEEVQVQLQATRAQIEVYCAGE
jgi:hypothetical protein